MEKSEENSAICPNKLDENNSPNVPENISSESSVLHLNVGVSSDGLESGNNEENPDLLPHTENSTSLEISKTVLEENNPQNQAESQLLNVNNAIEINSSNATKLQENLSDEIPHNKEIIKATENSANCAIQNDLLQKDTEACKVEEGNNLNNACNNEHSQFIGDVLKCRFGDYKVDGVSNSHKVKNMILFKCPFCPLKFKSGNQRRPHLHWHRIFRKHFSKSIIANNSIKKLKFSYLVNQHLKENIFQCPWCPFTEIFKFKKNFMVFMKHFERHLSLVGEKCKFRNCTYWNYNFNVQQHEYLHMRKRRKPKKIVTKLENIIEEEPEILIPTTNDTLEIGKTEIVDSNEVIAEEEFHEELIIVGGNEEENMEIANLSKPEVPQSEQEVSIQCQIDENDILSDNNHITITITSSENNGTSSVLESEIVAEILKSLQASANKGNNLYDNSNNIEIINELEEQQEEEHEEFPEENFIITIEQDGQADDSDESNNGNGPVKYYDANALKAILGVQNSVCVEVVNGSDEEIEGEQVYQEMWPVDANDLRNSAEQNIMDGTFDEETNYNDDNHQFYTESMNYNSDSSDDVIVVPITKAASNYQKQSAARRNKSSQNRQTSQAKFKSQFSISCPICPFRHDKNTIVKHIVTHAVKVKGLYQCPLCNVVKRNKEYICDHVKVDHSRAIFQKCVN